jgi:CheY-like chemotaxis protein
MTLILIVDDEPGIRSSACQALEDAGYQTVAAASASEAKAVIGLTVPDLIVMDIRLPDTSGLDLAIRLQPTYPKIPVLFISAWMERLPPDVSLAPLHQAFLHKPYTSEALVKAVRILLSASARV